MGYSLLFSLLARAVSALDSLLIFKIVNLVVPALHARIISKF
jgi:hypothetical protein